MSLLPREEKFYHLFLNQVEIISEASRLLLEGVRDGNARLTKRLTKSGPWSTKATKSSTRFSPA